MCTFSVTRMVFLFCIHNMSVRLFFRLVIVWIVINTMGLSVRPELVVFLLFVICLFVVGVCCCRYRCGSC